MTEGHATKGYHGDRDEGAFAVLIVDDRQRAKMLRDWDARVSRRPTFFGAGKERPDGNTGNCGYVILW
jgi:hypothetical protein